ncbi:MAG TPA: class I SAM-dependent methyltransferase [Pyrinomonadaceae bacterium]|jgi:2-polyprenyl-3-methyl-5-hydroxy-6-metoxy-1,4-benzoquinol methylase|nr:class I SAM-dependent methyltransferase [Pyrinomonadaceae bacterium]
MSVENESIEELNEDERFDAGASRYADYLQTVEGRLRLDLAWANLREKLEETKTNATDENTTDENVKAAGGKGRALDVGGGTGALALRLAASGWRVTVIDSSASMLALAAESARRAGVAKLVSFQLGDAARLAELFPDASFDLAVCHNVIEYTEDPRAVFDAMSAALRPGALVSVLARNRAGEAMRAAIKARDLDAARNALTAEHVRESLYGGPARLFDAASLRALAAAASLEVIAERGVRVVADYLPPALSETAAAYERLLQFEYELGARTDFAQVARYAQLIARRR